MKATTRLHRLVKYMRKENILELQCTLDELGPVKLILDAIPTETSQPHVIEKVEEISEEQQAQDYREMLFSSAG